MHFLLTSNRNRAILLLIVNRKGGRQSRSPPADRESMGTRTMWRRSAGAPEGDETHEREQRQE
jgi:hypothetical protein